jgi:hypothetical protein
MRFDRLPAYADGGLRSRTTWTDRECARWDANRRYAQAREFGCDIKRLTFVRWLVWNGTISDELPGGARQ